MMSKLLLPLTIFVLFNTVLVFNGLGQDVTPNQIDSIIANPELSNQAKVNKVLQAVKNTYGNHERISQQLKETLQMAKKSNLLDEEISLYCAIARLGIFLEELDSTYYYANEAIDRIKTTGENARFTEPVSLIMSAYYYQDRNQEAIDLFNEYKGYVHKDSIDNLELQFYYGAAINYEMLDEIDSTIYYLDLTVNRLNKAAYFDEYVSVSGTLLAVLSEYNRIDQADELIEDIIAYKGEIKDSSNMLPINMSLGQYFKETKNFNQAKKVLLEGLEISEKYGFEGESMTIYGELSKIEEAQGNYASSLRYLKVYQDRKDSLKNAELLIANQEFEKKYQNDKLIIENLEKESIIRQEENNRIKAEANAIESREKFYISLFIMVLIIVLASFIIFFVVNNKKKDALKAKLLKEAIERDLAENQLKAIRSQMNPHFVFNSINSIQGLILNEEIQKSYDYLLQFSLLLRNTLDYSKNEFTSLDHEIEYLELYLSLEKLRFQGDFVYTIENQVSEDHMVPSIMIQPFVENAIKHGLFHKEGDKKLSIRFFQKEELICTITDNGIGRDKAAEIKNRQKRKHTSFSTDAITKRMEILQEKYGAKVFYNTVDLYTDQNEPAGTKVTLHLPTQY